MKILENSRPDSDSVNPRFLDINTIRRRVAAIKQGWSPETVKARSTEGARRRHVLEDLILERLCDTSDSEVSCDVDEPEFSLVG
ncbi:MAG: hypothetical protein AB8B50_08015 [Pirellulaceae bacterium]